MNPAENRSLPGTDRTLSPIGLGTWQFSSGRGTLGGHWDPLSDETMRAVVDAALENGIDWFDTAEAYGDGASEENLSRALQACGVAPGAVTIADKWWPKERRAASLVETIDERLRRLAPYPIDLYQIHWPESKSWLRTEMNALATLVERGKVRSVGLCNYSGKLIRRAAKWLRRRDVPLASIQVRYSLLYRFVETNGVLDAAKELGLAVIAWSPLEQGLLTGRFHDDPASMDGLKEGRRKMFGIEPARVEATAPLIASLRRIGERHEATPAQVALAWLVQFHGDLVFAIPGASNPKQATENAGAMRLTLSAEELRELDERSRSF